MNLVRLGHYFVPNGPVAEGEIITGSCRTALVTGSGAYGGADDGTVNVAVWEHRGVSEGYHTNLPVIERGQRTPVDEDSFHLSVDCPWLR